MDWHAHEYDIHGGCSLGCRGCTIERLTAELAETKAKAELLQDALSAIVFYRDRVGPLGFQLEKFDWLLHRARLAIHDHPRPGSQ
jgi:hypothetical protein